LYKPYSKLRGVAIDYEQRNRRRVRSAHQQSSNDARAGPESAVVCRRRQVLASEAGILIIISPIVRRRPSIRPNVYIMTRSDFQHANVLIAAPCSSEKYFFFKILIVFTEIVARSSQKRKGPSYVLSFVASVQGTLDDGWNNSSPALLLQIR
jgi:hypothetical protein